MDRHQPDTACSGVNQDLLATPETGEVLERVGGSEVCDREGGGPLEVESARQVEDEIGPGHYVGPEAAVGDRPHSIAHLNSRHTLSNGRDDTRTLVTQRAALDRILSQRLEDVLEVEAYGRHLDLDLSLGRRPTGHLPENQAVEKTRGPYIQEVGALGRDLEGVPLIVEPTTNEASHETLILPERHLALL